MRNKQCGRVMLSLVTIVALVVAVICLLPIRPRVADAASGGVIVQIKVGDSWVNTESCTVYDTIRVGANGIGGSIHFRFSPPGGASEIDLGTVAADQEGNVWLVIDPAINPLPHGAVGMGTFNTDRQIGSYICGSYQVPYSCNYHCCSYDWLGRCTGTCWDTCYETRYIYCPSYAYAQLTITDTPPVIRSVTANPSMVADGDAVWVVVDAFDNVDVTSVTANGTLLGHPFMGGPWMGDVTASSTLGSHQIEVVATDTASNTTSDASAGYKTCRVMGMNVRNASDPVVADLAGTLLFKFWGKLSISEMGVLSLDDGSGTPLLINTPGYSVGDGDYISARGALSTGSPLTLNSTDDWLKKL